jgi:hypothetical protein
MDSTKTREEPPDFGQDLDFQRREWAAQRVGWIVLALLIVAALAGLLGDGPLSRTQAASHDGALRLQFDRFARVGATTMLRLRFRPAHNGDGNHRIWLQGGYQEATRIREVSPTPDHVEDDRGRVVYVFRAFQPERSTEVAFYVQPRNPGLQSGRIGVVDGASVAFRQFIYP